MYKEEKEFNDRAYEAYKKLFPLFPWIVGDKHHPNDFHAHYDGVSGFGGASEAFDTYLMQRLMELSDSNANGKTDLGSLMSAMNYEVLRGIALSLLLILEELERGHDNITRAINDGSL